MIHVMSEVVVGVDVEAGVEHDHIKAGVEVV